MDYRNEQRLTPPTSRISGWMRTGVLSVLMTTASAPSPGFAAPPPAQAPDVVVLCNISLRQALAAAGHAWQDKTGVPVRVFTASLEQNAGLVVHGARADIVVGIDAQRIDDAQKLGAFERGAPVVIGHDPIVLAVRGGGGQPLQFRPGDDAGAALGNGQIGVTDTAIGSAGADTRIALAAVGLWPSLKPRSMGAETTDSLKQLLRDGHVALVALYKTDLAGETDLTVRASFPSTPAPTVAAALAMKSESPHAKDFLAFLTLDGQTVLRQNGMEPP